MKIIKDESAYDEFQMHILYEMAGDIKKELISAGIKGDQLEDKLGNILFSISAIIDGSRVMEYEGKPVLPSLGFSKNDQHEEIIMQQGGSWMHEYVFGCVDEILEEE